MASPIVDFKEHAKMGKQPVDQLGEIPTKCSKEDSNFILILDSLDHQMTTIQDLLNTKSKDRIVESYGRYNSYLLTVDKVSKYSWIFLTVILT